MTVERKNSVDGFNGRISELDIAEKWVSKIENMKVKLYDRNGVNIYTVGLSKGRKILKQYVKK